MTAHYKRTDATGIIEQHISENPESLVPRASEGTPSPTITLTSTDSSLTDASPSPATPTAGRELDTRIATQVFGWDVAPPAAAVMRFVSMGNTLNPSNVPHYSTKIADAWLVVEKLRADGWCMAVHEELYTDGTYQWVATFTRGVGEEYEDTGEELAPTAAHVICLAALKALEAAHV